ncbi:alpha/beta hydrolase [Agrobacterium sp. a22-2]|uniref:alpha/beta fold hydrolase n=1 Tax=Agrobacterium sp. a22-2 TaxID=2283840 RepID=UPI001444B396|nr:alpha/beta hydrolase [Agrobacterium sp. a22-2]NKN37931.1 alpha/beta hydrolase [Agrobacterium sp. a22-2]
MSDISQNGFIERHVTTDDGLRLYLRDYGSHHPGLPVICLPGLSRNSRDFHQLADLLSTDSTLPRRVITIDYRGRGLSDWDSDKSRYNLVVEAGDVIAVCAALGIPRAAFIGTSRGGLTLHLLAGMRPDLLAAVILNDIGPVIELAGLRQIQAYLGKERLPRDMDDAAKILKATHGASFPSLSDQDWRDMADAIYRETDGQLRADFDPAIAEALAAADLSQPLPDLWPQFDGFRTIPLMTVRGANSALLSRETLEAMAERHGAMQAVTVDGQGHAPILHLAEVPDRIRAFLARVK